MAKRSYRRPARPQRDNVGCMWGLISLFDFRRGHPTQKLLTDKKHGSSRYAGIGYSRIKLDLLGSSSNRHEGDSLVDEIREDEVNMGLTSVKTLMEEEMSQHPQKKIANEAQRGTSNLQNEVHPNKNYKQRSKKLELISDNQANNLAASASLDGYQSETVDLTGRSSLNFDLAAFLIEFYSYTCQQMHTGANNNFDLLPASGSIGTRIHNHLDELDDHLDQKISFFQKTLADVAQAIISQKTMVEKQPNGRWVFHPQEFMDALDTLNSDKELLLKLLQDPDSLLLKHMRSLHSTQVRKLLKQRSEKYLENAQLSGEDNESSGKCKESDNNHSNKLFHKQNRYNFFWKKDKSKATKPSKESPSSKALNRIVVLKPIPSRSQNSSIITTPSSSPQSHHVLRPEDGERIVSHFSLKEIKRRLRHMIGESRKARHVISMDGVLHRIPVRPKDAGDACKLTNSESVVACSASNSSCDAKKLSESLSLDKWKAKKIDSEECEIYINSHISSLRSQFLIYEEAKKHLAEMLDTGVDGLPIVQVSESLGRILSLPRDNELCTISSPQKDEDLVMSPEETGDPSLQQFEQEGPTNNLSLARQNLESSSCSVSIPTDELRLLILDTELVDSNMPELSCTREDLNNKGSIEILGAVDTKGIVESNGMDLPLKSSRNELIVANEIYEEDEESATLCGLGSFEEKSLAVTQSKFRPSSVFTENLVAPESTTEKPEQPSPISVLETFLSEDITSPESTTAEHCDIQVQHEVNYEDCGNSLRIIASPDINDSLRDCLHDNQARFDYVKALLEASGLTNEFSESWDMADQLLEPSLFDEIGIFFCFLQDDPKLLFDCINEVLEEIQERFLKCTPWLSFIKPNVLPAPLGDSLIQEVSEGLEWHLHIQLPNTLDQVVRKDLDGRSWMDLRFETENITTEICEEILDNLMEESVRDSWF